MLPITQVNGSANKTSCAKRIPKFIVIHYTAGVSSKLGSARNVALYFANPNAKASADFIVDDGSIVQYNGKIETTYCWAVGGGKQSAYGGSYYGKCTNANSISIEICSNNKTGRVTKAGDKNWYFTDSAVKNALELTRFLMAKYGIPKENVIRHFDVNGKYCPSCVGWNERVDSDASWKAFKAQLGQSVVESKPVAENPKPVSTGSYVVRITASVLHVRKDATTASDIVAKVKKDDAYTIVEERNGWGKLKSGIGWISLNYTKRV